MSRDVWVNRCRQKIHSRFLLTQAAVLRWEQLLRGARPRIQTERPRHMETPLRELATGAVSLDDESLLVELRGAPYEQPRPEPEDELLSEIEASVEEVVQAAKAKAAPQTPPEPSTPPGAGEAA